MFDSMRIEDIIIFMLYVFHYLIITPVYVKLFYRIYEFIKDIYNDSVNY
jgi:hypothetical protein